MLQVAVGRLSRLFPSASIEVVTSNREALENAVPPANALDADGMKQWFSERYFLGSLHNVLPNLVSRAMIRMKRAFQHGWPGLVMALVKARIVVTGRRDPRLIHFLRSVAQADLFVVCGQGSIADVFPSSASSALDFIEMASATGKPVVLLGQGIGPLTDSALCRRVSRVFPQTHLIALREGKHGPHLLERLKITNRAFAVTGDDAIEMAYNARPSERGAAIGVNIRFEHHTGIGPEINEVLRPVFRRLAADFEAKLLPIPISRYPDLKDSRDIESLLSYIDNFENIGRDLDTPLKVINQVGRCRVVVTAAYHAAVFALSQGIPVVGLVGSRYCLYKFQGLGHQFGTGVEIIMLNSPTLTEDLRQAIERSWVAAERVRDPLLDSARRQIEAGNFALGRVAGMFGVEMAASSTVRVL